MLLGLYSVYDTAAGAYANPSPVISKEAAIRSFGDAVRAASNEWSKHPEDYILMYLGTFDQITGELHPELPSRVISALECSATLAVAA